MEDGEGNAGEWECMAQRAVSIQQGTMASSSLSILATKSALNQYFPHRNWPAKNFCMPWPLPHSTSSSSLCMSQHHCSRTDSEPSLGVCRPPELQERSGIPPKKHEYLSGDRACRFPQHLKDKYNAIEIRNYWSRESESIFMDLADRIST